MPCADQTEVFELLLDNQECILDLRLFKRTCGQPVGGNQILPHILGKNAHDLLQYNIERWIPNLSQLRLFDEFMLFKQFFSLRAALAVWSGQQQGSSQDTFALEELSYDEDGRCLLVGQIAIEILQQEIRACGSCRSCQPKSVAEA
jgi:hypothetical protein